VPLHVDTSPRKSRKSMPRHVAPWSHMRPQRLPYFTGRCVGQKVGKSMSRHEAPQSHMRPPRFPYFPGYVSPRKVGKSMTRPVAPWSPTHRPRCSYFVLGDVSPRTVGKSMPMLAAAWSHAWHHGATCVDKDVLTVPSDVSPRGIYKYMLTRVAASMQPHAST
jgi:hypothetical protein